MKRMNNKTYLSYNYDSEKLIYNIYTIYVEKFLMSTIIAVTVTVRCC